MRQRVFNNCAYHNYPGGEIIGKGILFTLKFNETEGVSLPGANWKYVISRFSQMLHETSVIPVQRSGWKKNNDKQDRQKHKMCKK